MRLHRVQLRNYRGVANSDVSFSQDGVTVVEGPNEVGKTAIAEGLRLAIEQPDSSGRADVKAVKPVGRDVGPEVEFTLSSGEYELTFRKRWLRQPETTLEVIAPHHESFTGRAAHDRLQAILDETLDEELWKALRIEQGTKLILPKFGLPSLGRALDRAAGGETTSDREDTLWARIEEEYAKYWTPTGQARGDRRSLGAGVEEAKEKVAGLEQQLQDVESATARMDWLTGEEARLSNTKKSCESRVRELNESSAAVSGLLTEVERLDALHIAAEAQRDAAVGQWNQRKSLIATLETATEELKALESEVETAAPSLTAAQVLRDNTSKALEDAETALQRAQQGLRRAVADRDHLRQLIEVVQLKERHTRYQEAEELLKKAEAHLESATVDGEVAEQIERAYIDDEIAKAAAGSAAASVEVVALRDVAAEIGGERIELAATEANHTLVEDDLLVVIPEVVRIQISAGAGSKDLAEVRRRAQEAYRRLCEAAGVSGVADAKKAAQELQDTLREKGVAQEAIRRELRDLTPDVLLGKIKNLSVRIASYPNERPKDPPLPGNLDEAQRIEAEVSADFDTCNGKLAECKRKAEEAKASLNQAELDNAGRAAKITLAQGTKNEALSRLSSEREEESDEALTAAVVATGEKEANARKLLDGAKAALDEANPDSIRALLESAEGALTRATKELDSNRSSQVDLKARLSARGEEGIYTAHQEATNRFNHVTREYERQEARADAARLLLQTFSRHRQEARERYMKPFKERIDQLGHIAFGPTFAVELGEDLQVKRRTLDGVTLEVSQLSIGAQEQLGVLCRLACATIVSPDDGGVPVMIDDALGWSDPQRLQSMGAAISAAGKQCQVIVLTCTPGRYAHVGRAQVVSLGS